MDVVFWIHIIIIIIAVLISFYFSIFVIIIIVLLHRLHVVYFDDCVISNIQRKNGTLFEDETFFQQASKKLVGKEITSNQSVWVDNLLVWLVLGISLVVSSIRLIKN